MAEQALVGFVRIELPVLRLRPRDRFAWRGFHHHAALVLLAYGFLLLERQRATAKRRRARKKGAPSRC